MFNYSGETDGLAWSIEGKVAHDGRLFAMVQVGSTKKVTQKTYNTESEAQAAGHELMADTLAELVDEVAV
jgi:hypothetical protein